MFSFNCEIAINIYTFDVICIQCEWMGIEVSILRYKFPKYFYVFTIFSIYDIAMVEGTKNIYWTQNDLVNM